MSEARNKTATRSIALVGADGNAATSTLLADAAEALPVYARLSSVAAPELVRAAAGSPVCIFTVLKTSLEGIDKLTLDFSGLSYLSSAGLRVVLLAQKYMSKHGKMIVKNVNETIMDVFEVTGFTDILTIE